VPPVVREDAISKRERGEKKKKKRGLSVKAAMSHMGPMSQCHHHHYIHLFMA
jgi:hypothetical protein